jgi:hypothetical protein
MDGEVGSDGKCILQKSPLSLMVLKELYCLIAVAFCDLYPRNIRQIRPPFFSSPRVL